jgi:MFS family permease
MSAITSEKRNVFLLVSTQALFQTASVIMVTISGLVGLELATDKSLATLPVAMTLVATALMIIPASLLMQRYGRRNGFLLGTALGWLAGLTAAAAIWIHSFWLFVVATILMGGYQAFSQYYRFAAADAVSENFRSRAISWVVSGGVVAAIAGPTLVRLTQSLGPITFIVPYFVITALGLVAMLLVTQLHLPPMTIVNSDAPSRPLGVILRQPVFITALIGSAVGASMMIMVMTATPLAMHMSHHPVDASTTVIQWHVLGMFLPSFFTGTLIAHFGVLRIMTIGVALFAIHVTISMLGTEFIHFVSELTILGVGWNFLFVGGTTLLTQACYPNERAKTQAIHDFLVNGLGSIMSFSAGSLLYTFGWQAVNLTVIPFLVVALLAIIFLSVNRRRGAREVPV